MRAGIDPTHLREYIIEPTLKHLASWNPRLDSEAAVRLLLMTAAHESRMGHFLQQQGAPLSGAVGIWQMEPRTTSDLVGWAMKDEHLWQLVKGLRMSGYFPMSVITEMRGNLFLACALARLYYWRRPEPLPDAYDTRGLAVYAKKHYNTHLGKATADDYYKAAIDWEVA